MAQPSDCLGHQARENRRNQIVKISTRPKEAPDENYRVSIKKGPVSVETSLKDLEDNYESKPEWKLIEDGGVLSIPVEELRMENPPRPDRSGQVVFKEKKGGGGKQIESYPVGQTIENLNELILVRYEEQKKKAKKSGKPGKQKQKSKSKAETSTAAAAATEENKEVSKWLGTKI